MRVRETGRDLDLAQEALGPDGGGELGAQDLDCDGPSVLQVLCLIDGAHAAGPELRAQGVTIGQRRAQELGLVAHQRVKAIRCGGGDVRFARLRQLPAGRPRGASASVGRRPARAAELVTASHLADAGQAGLIPLCRHGSRSSETG